MLENFIPFPVSEEPELEEPDWEHLIEELQRAHKFMRSAAVHVSPVAREVPISPKV